MATPFRVLDDLRATARELAAERPDLARRIEADTDTLLDLIPAVTISQVVDELSVTRPTVHAWLRRGLLAPPEGSEQPPFRLVSPQSVLALIPPIREWQAAGRPGRPTTFIERWQQRARDLAAQREEVGRRRMGGEDPRRWPGGRAVE